MTRRSRAREVALQLLFQRDHNPRMSREAVGQFVRHRLREPELRSFCLALFDGILAHLPEIDARLAEAAENWRLPRMAGVDRNVLRIGAFEILHMPDTPPSVALDEAIELARRFGSADSPKFVNGVLDKLWLNAGVGRPAARVPSSPSADDGQHPEIGSPAAGEPDSHPATSSDG